MSVELDPVELGFKRPFTREVTETLRLRNPNSDPIIFKVKTTAPKKYAVRPNSGRIEAGQEVEVSVLLQALKEDPPESEKCRDKFLVQSVSVSADQEFSNITAIWANIESTAKSSIQEKKIRVNWLSPNGTASSGGISTPLRSTMNHDSSAPAYSSPAFASTPQSHISSTPGTIDYTTMPRTTKQEGEYNPSSSTATTTNGTTGTTSSSTSASTGQQQSTIGAAISAVTSVIPNSVAAVVPSSDDVKNQLAEAQATIARLTQQVQDQGLRQRKTESVSNNISERASTTTTHMKQAASTGVPVPITAALCLLSFLLAYLLF